MVRRRSERRGLLNIVGLIVDYSFEISALRAYDLGIGRVDRLCITTSTTEIS